EAARLAPELPRLFPDGWAEYHRAAGYLVRCGFVAAKDDKLPGSERLTLSTSYADQAVALLRQAVEKGYRNADELEKTPVFRPLLRHDDFQRLLAELRTKTKL